MYFLIRAAAACTMNLGPAERDALYDALELEIPAVGAHPADDLYRFWRRTGQHEAVADLGLRAL